jgi:ankyrin repeat protein
MTFQDLLESFQLKDDDKIVFEIEQFLFAANIDERKEVLTKMNQHPYSYHATVLAELSCYNKPKAFEKLLSLQLENPNQVNSNCVGALSNAIISGPFLDIVKLLIRYGANPNEVDRHSGSTLFHYLCGNHYKNEHMKVLDYFFTLPINFEQVNLRGYSAFLGSFCRGNLNFEVIEYLLNSPLATRESLDKALEYLDDKMKFSAHHYDKVYELTLARLEKKQLEEKMNEPQEVDLVNRMFEKIKL